MRKQILIVEDEQALASVYEAELISEGFSVQKRLNGISGLDTALTENFDLILLDIMLPDKNGIEILQEIRKNPSTTTTPVIMLTNLGDEETIKNAYKKGATGYLYKAQYTPGQIVKKVQEALS